MRARLVLAVVPVALLLCASGPALAAPRPGFGWPLPGRPVVERPFLPPATAYGPGHRGVDLSATLGQLVLAAGPGWVTYAGMLAGRGVVTVTHAGGLRTTYEPVEPSVHVGDAVVHGSVLGHLSVGHAACRRFTCLHWGLLRGQLYLDPLWLLRSGPLRLKPPAAGSALSGAARVQPLLGAPAAPVRQPAGAPGHPATRPVAAVSPLAVAAVGGAALLGWTALRRQDARRRSPRRVPHVSGGP
jgi:murein DD-endopeptidase MepM/ murein hydrolase activator NlpD